MYSDKKASLITFFIILFSFISTTSADGGGFIYHPPTPDDDSYWSLLDEKSQTAFINYEDGFENMILSIKTGELDGERAVWLFPIPSTPDKVSIDILNTFPDFDGYNFKDKAKERIDDTIYIMTYTQIYPGIYALAMASLGAVQSDASASFNDYMYDSTLKIHEHIESMGLTSELITAKDSESIKQYMELNNLTLPDDANSIIGEYIGKDYSFVMTWINDIGEFRYNSHQTNSLGASITFPTDNIYFPLRLTSIYGSKIIPIEIYITDFVTPKYYGSLESTSKSEYYIDKSYPVPDNLKRFFNNKEHIEDLKYTKISINEASKFFTDDLWLKDSTPLKVSFQDFFYSYASIWGIIIFIIMTSLAGAIAGKAIYRNSSTTAKEFALLGLSNIFTIIGLAIMTKIKTIEDPTSNSTPNKRTTKEIIKTSSCFAAILTALLVITTHSYDNLTTYMLSLILGIPLILEYLILTTIPYIAHAISYYWDRNILTMIIFSFAGYFIITYPLIKCIHKSRKLRFIALFSIIFLILTYLTGIILKAIV